MSSGWKGGDPKNFRANLTLLLGPFIKDVINRGKGVCPMIILLDNKVYFVKVMTKGGRVSKISKN